MSDTGTRTYWRAYGRTGVFGELVTEAYDPETGNTVEFSSPGYIDPRMVRPVSPGFVPAIRGGGVTRMVPSGSPGGLGRVPNVFRTPGSRNIDSDGWAAAMARALERAALAAARELVRDFSIEGDWVQLPARAPAGWQVNAECSIPPKPAGVSFASGSNCGAVSAALSPPSSAFNPAWGSLEEWGPTDHTDIFNWTVYRKWVPGTADPTAPWTPAYTVPRELTRQLHSPFAFVRAPRNDREPTRHDQDGRRRGWEYRRAALTVSWPRYGNRGPVRVRTGAHYQLPSRPTMKGKGNLPAGFLATLRLFHAATELGDYVDALYNALGIFKCRGAKTMTARMFCIGKNWERYFSDPGIMAAAMRNLVLNEVEDRIMGRLFGAGWQRGVRPFRDTYSEGAYVSTPADALLGGGSHIEGSEHSVLPVWSL